MSKDLAERFDDAERVAEMYLKGMSATAIARETGLTRAKVLENIKQWSEFVTQDSDIKGRAKELLLQVDHHYSMLIKDLWYVVDHAKGTNDLKEMTSALKALAQVEKDRSQLYSTAGITADDELAEQLAKMEMEHDQIKQILKEVSADCPRCRAKVYSALAQINGQPEVIVVEQAREDIE